MQSNEIIDAMCILLEPLEAKYKLDHVENFVFNEPDSYGGYAIWLRDVSKKFSLLFNYFPRSGDVNCYLSKTEGTPKYPLDDNWCPYKRVLRKNIKISLTDAKKIAEEYTELKNADYTDMLNEVIDDVDKNYKHLANLILTK